ncbi:MAG: hypothetical protein LBE38_08140 [Deltaproteobacteria bacterium]|nr:hypothetical protein [Deltaproteobacteria bacterium]
MKKNHESCSNFANNTSEENPGSMKVNQTPPIPGKDNSSQQEPPRDSSEPEASTNCNSKKDKAVDSPAKEEPIARQNFLLANLKKPTDTFLFLSVMTPFFLQFIKKLWKSVEDGIIDLKQVLVPQFFQKDSEKIFLYTPRELKDIAVEIFKKLVQEINILQSTLILDPERRRWPLEGSPLAKGYRNSFQNIREIILNLNITHSQLDIIYQQFKNWCQNRGIIFPSWIANPEKYIRGQSPFDHKSTINDFQVVQEDGLGLAKFVNDSQIIKTSVSPENELNNLLVIPTGMTIGEGIKLLFPAAYCKLEIMEIKHHLCDCFKELISTLAKCHCARLRNSKLFADMYQEGMYGLLVGLNSINLPSTNEDMAQYLYQQINHAMDQFSYSLRKDKECFQHDFSRYPWMGL